VGRGHRELTKITHGTGRGDRGGGAEEEGSGRKLKKRSTTRGVKTPRTNLGRVASREPRREEEAARAKQASKQAVSVESIPEQEAGARTRFSSLLPQSPCFSSLLSQPHARARRKRGEEASEHAPRRRRADLPESGAGSSTLTRGRGI
jgi:hypothetical protein